MFKKVVGVGATALLLVGVPQFAQAEAPSVQEILNSITVDPIGNSSINVATDALVDDSFWSISGSGGSLATLIIEVAGWGGTNTFGIYDATDITKQVEVFSGAAAAGTQAMVSIKSDGSVIRNLFEDTLVDFAGNVFGFYFGTTDGTWYSNTGSNPDSFDHLWVFQGVGDTVQLPTYAPGVWGPNEYILAWEDTAGGGDGDHNDMVLMVESVTQAPEPGTLLLLGSGLLGIGLMRRKMQFRG